MAQAYMEYYSTKNKSDNVSFRTALFKGLAPDGGLYLPKGIPLLEKKIITPNTHYAELSYNMIKPYVKNDIPNRILKDICIDSFSFDIPLIHLNDGTKVLELFHGPTLAFKDFAVRFMARCMSYLMNQKITILVATSGDTGGAVANGFLNIEGINVVILYPSKRVSKVQEKQLTGLSNNIKALEVDGNFDDCQDMVKKAFLDKDLNNKINVSSANSINIARLIPQAVFYAYAWSLTQQDKLPLVISVPSGNFGNITGGVIAKNMGIPISKLIASNNINDAFIHYLKNNTITNNRSKKTISNAMDVSIPSNLERILNLYKNKLNLLKKDISGYSYNDKKTLQCIEEFYLKYDYILDPHSAIGVLGLKEFGHGHDMNGIVFSTAHPIKFSESIREPMESALSVPESLKQLLELKKESVKIKNEYASLKEYLLK